VQEAHRVVSQRRQSHALATAWRVRILLYMIFIV
jgi:hypothetical protein